MRLPAGRAAAVFLLLARSLTAFAQSPAAAAGQPLYQFGDPAPLTNTRYAPVDAAGTLASNGSGFFFFWTHGGHVRVSPIVDGAALMGRAILPGSETPAVIWTGDRFIVASGNLTRVLDARGEPIGDAAVVTPFADDPQLATNGRTVVLTARVPASTRAWVLTNDGRSVDSGIPIQGASIASNGDGFTLVSRAAAGALQVTTLHANGTLRSQQVVESGSVASPVIASDGRDYLVVWTAGNSVKACSIDANGAIHPAFTVATASASGAIAGSSVVWAGDRYAIACASSDRVDVVYVGLHSSSTYETTTLAGTSSFAPSLAFAGGRLLASWGTAGGTMIRELRSWSDNAIPAAWSATGQTLLKAVAASKGTLVVWRETIEQGRWYAGMRGYDGSWVERRLPGSSYQHVATNGEDFVLVSSGTATRLNASGVPLVGTTQLPFAPQSIVWNGRAYVMAAVWSGVIFTATLDRAGAVSPIAVIQPQSGRSISAPQLASDGTNVLLVWRSPAPLSIDGTLLDPELRELTPNGFTIEPLSLSANTTDVAWDGARYVIVTSSAGIRARVISREGVPDPLPVSFSDRFVPSFSIARVNDGILVVWPDTNGPGATLQDNVRILDRNGVVTALAPIPRRERFDDEQLVALPANRIGYFTRRTMSDSEPYFAAERLAMAIADASWQPRVPNSPKVSAAFESDTTLRVSWMIPSQSVNGYRLEYQIGDEAWLEFDRWFGASETTYAIALARRRSTPYRFRVRAWSDAGVSAYSQPVAVTFGKRRAVR